MTTPNGIQKWLPWIFGIILAALVAVGASFWLKAPSSIPEESVTQKPAATAPAPTVSAAPLASPSPDASASPQPLPTGTDKVDLSVDPNGMSKSTVVMTTTQGVIKFKFYPQDAPRTVNRIVELIQRDFYNGLIFHRVVPGFVIQGGDPTGTGTGGSGQKLKAEFNNRHHVEGAVAMARASDPDSADSQFYISLGTHPHLDHNYTIFGQVVEGMDVVRKIHVGDKIVSVVIQ